VKGPYPLTAIYAGDTGEPAEVTITWESSDEPALSFDENANGTAKSLGSVTLRSNLVKCQCRDRREGRGR